MRFVFSIRLYCIDQAAFIFGRKIGICYISLGQHICCVKVWICILESQLLSTDMAAYRQSRCPNNVGAFVKYYTNTNTTKCIPTTVYVMVLSVSLAINFQLFRLSPQSNPKLLKPSGPVDRLFGTASPDSMRFFPASLRLTPMSKQGHTVTYLRFKIYLNKVITKSFEIYIMPPCDTSSSLSLCVRCNGWIPLIEDR